MVFPIKGHGPIDQGVEKHSQGPTVYLETQHTGSYNTVYLETQHTGSYNTVYLETLLSTWKHNTLVVTIVSIAFLYGGLSSTQTSRLLIYYCWFVMVILPTVFTPVCWLR